MICQEKEGLVAEYGAAAQKFAEAVVELQRRIGTSNLPDYDWLQLVSDEARLKSEQARLALELHTIAHGC